MLRPGRVAFQPFACRYANGGRCTTYWGIGDQGLGDRQPERPFDVTGIEDHGFAAGEGQAELPVDLPCRPRSCLSGQPLRLGVDPLHAHLLLPGARGPVKLHLAFWSAANWVRQLKRKRLDAVWLPLAGMVGPSEPPEPPALTAASALNPSLGDPEVVAIALATTGLPFLLAHSPWREAGLVALPAADPLWEALWLLVRQEQLGAGWVEELGVGER